MRVIDDLAEVMKLQKEHGGWIDEMSNVKSCYDFSDNERRVGLSF